MASIGRQARKLSGIAGELFVAAELTRRGFAATITMKNTADFDILAADLASHENLRIQVKTNERAYRKAWVLNKKCETLVAPNFHYIFVNLAGLRTPEYHIVPSSDVAKTVKDGQILHMQTLRRNGEKRKETNMRMFFDKSDKYKEAWELLK